jgi:hypothetical protein
VFFKNDILDERFKMLMNVIVAKEMDYITCITARRYAYKDTVFLRTFYLQFVVFEICNLLLIIWKSLHVAKPALSKWHCGKSLLFTDIEIFSKFPWLVCTRIALDLMLKNFVFCLCSLFVYFV